MAAFFLGMTAALLEWETIDADQINDIMAGKPPRAPQVSASSPVPLPAVPSEAVVEPIAEPESATKPVLPDDTKLPPDDPAAGKP